MKNYKYVKDNFFNNITSEQDYINQFNTMREALGVSLFEDDGTYKDMDTLFGDITIAYLIYQHDVNGHKFCGL